MSKYRFRKVYVICEDNKIFGQVTANDMYLDKQHCKQVANTKQGKAFETSKNGMG